MKVHANSTYEIDNSNTKSMAGKKVEIFSSGHMMQIMAKSTYTRPIEAVVRETIANAMDASRGKKFDVTVPSLLDPNFKVRDYGIGMTEEFFLNGYNQVGFSTKGQSNDEVGGFGMGRFAAFAYEGCDQYYVRGVKDGQFFLGSVWRDEQFNIELQVENRGTTDDPDGLEVTIPVLTADLGQFEDAIKVFTECLGEQVTTGLAKVVRPVLFEGADKSWRISQFGYVHNAPTFFHHPVRAIMGGVPYKLDLQQVYGYDTAARMSVTAGDFVFPIGSLSIPASREELRYDDFTKQAIKDKFIQIRIELEAEVAKRQASFTTDFERWTDPAIGQYREALDKLSKRLSKNELHGVQLIQQMNKARQFGGRSSAAIDSVEFTPGNTYLCVVIDTVKWRVRYQSWLQKTIDAADTAKGKNVTGAIIILTREDSVATMGNIPFVKTSDMPEPPKVPRQPRAPGVVAVAGPRVQRAAQTGKYNYNKLIWDMAPNDYSQKGVIYISGEVSRPNDDQQKLWNIVSNAQELKDVVLVPRVDLPLAVAAGWISLEDHLKKLVTPEVIHGACLQRGWYQLRWGGSDSTKLIQLNQLLSIGFKMPNQNLAKNITALTKVNRRDSSELSFYMESLITHFGMVMPPDDDKYIVKDHLDAYLTAHPLLKVLLEQDVFKEAESKKIPATKLLAIANQSL